MWFVSLLQMWFESAHHDSHKLLFLEELNYNIRSAQEDTGVHQDIVQ